jgi:copper chaperone
MPNGVTYLVSGMSCAHCEAAVKEAVAGVPGVAAVDVDLDTKRVVVSGEGLSDKAVRAAIIDAGYEAA